MKHTKKTRIMNREIQAISHDMSRIVEDARGLMTATADMAEEKIGEARERLANALERGRETYGCVRDQSVASTRAANEVLHRHPYQALGIGVGIAALLGYLVARRMGWSRNDN